MRGELGKSAFMKKQQRRGVTRPGCAAVSTKTPVKCLLVLFCFVFLPTSVVKEAPRSTHLFVCLLQRRSRRRAKGRRSEQQRENHMETHTPHTTHHTRKDKHKERRKRGPLSRKMVWCLNHQCSSDWCMTKVSNHGGRPQQHANTTTTTTPRKRSNIWKPHTHTHTHTQMGTYTQSSKEFTGASCARKTLPWRPGGRCAPGRGSARERASPTGPGSGSRRSWRWRQRWP
jgi:hypothetical protein